ncbi:MAG: cytochrome c-type biogenesis protein [Burkholderiales bacterium]
MMRVVIACLCCAVIGLAYGQQPTVEQRDPAIESRVRALAEELRCLVCQNQTIADSNADLAIDLRNQIRAKIKAGLSDAQIKQYMVDRYGDFVLYRPPVQPNTVLLWLGPFALLVLGLAALFWQLARRRRAAPAIDLSAADHQRADDLLDNSTKNRPDSST